MPHITIDNLTLYAHEPVFCAKEVFTKRNEVRCFAIHADSKNVFQSKFDNKTPYHSSVIEHTIGI